MASFAVVNGLKYSSLYNIIPNIRPHHAWALYNTLEIILRLVQKMSTQEGREIELPAMGLRFLQMEEV